MDGLNALLAALHPDTLQANVAGIGVPSNGKQHLHKRREVSIRWIITGLHGPQSDSKAAFYCSLKH